MASLKDLRMRIASVKATRKITKAMQMVAAAKLRRAQDAALAAKPYAERMERMLGNLNARIVKTSLTSKLLTGTGQEESYLFIVATAERGLAGAFNTNIVKLAREQIRRKIADGKTVKILCIGRKGYDALKRDYGKLIIDTIDLKSVKRLGYDNAQDISRRVMKMFGAGEFDVAMIFYSEFVNVLTQKPKALQIIPAQLPEGATAVAQSSGPTADYEFEPDEDAILDDLLPRNIGTQIFRALLENAAGEQGARMTAMDNATRNAGDMIKRLTLNYNRQRQANITRELIEIISGAEAL
ncbi:MAG: F0F1 ATP synthase subunit gamma [Hyphomicrobiales bacterium]|nr:F0F1 ATP synthase subunit gamma [Hyphomicrobiales bacterium]